MLSVIVMMFLCAFLVGSKIMKKLHNRKLKRTLEALLALSTEPTYKDVCVKLLDTAEAIEITNLEDLSQGQNGKVDKFMYNGEMYVRKTYICREMDMLELKILIGCMKDASLCKCVGMKTFSNVVDSTIRQDVPLDAIFLSPQKHIFLTYISPLKITLSTLPYSPWSRT